MHLKNPELNGLALLHNTGVFTILLDNNAPIIAKVAKSYDFLTPSSLLSVKIASETIRDLGAHYFLKAVMKDNFQRGLEFELSQAQKLACKNIQFTRYHLPGATYKTQIMPNWNSWKAVAPNNNNKQRPSIA